MNGSGNIEDDERDTLREEGGEGEEGKGEIKGKDLFDDPKYMTAAWVQEHLSKAQV